MKMFVYVLNGVGGGVEKNQIKRKHPAPAPSSNTPKPGRRGPQDVVDEATLA